MNKFDLLYKNLMESMVAGGSASVFGSPANGVEIGSTGGAVGVNDDRAYNQGDTRLAKPIGKLQRRPNINGKKKNKK